MSYRVFETSVKFDLNYQVITDSLVSTKQKSYKLI